MTEIERLVETGRVPAEFLKEENRCGVILTEENKKMWAIYIDLLRETGDVCKRNGLTYTLGWGSILGAVRHKGFIPWDDDIDVWMPRPDYDKLLEIGPSEFKEPYFFQTIMTDEEYFYPAAKIMNLNTTSVISSKNKNCRKGMSISIFPIDGFANNEKLQRRRYNRARRMTMTANAYLLNTNKSFVARAANKILHLPFIPYTPKKAFVKLNNLAKKTKWGETDKVGVIIYGKPSWFRYYNIEDLQDFIEVPFEFITAPIPVGYDRMLKKIYKNYMEFPPIEKRVGNHNRNVYPEIPYEEYFKNYKDDGDNK